jgi:hypothetical protein
LAVAGGLIGIFGTRAAFTISAASFLVSTLLIAQLRIPAHAGQLGEGMKRGLENLFVSWSAIRLLTLTIGGVVVDTLGIRPLFWVGGTLLTLAGVLGLVLLRSYDFRHTAEETG